jgi:hypothetical protein
VSILFLLKTIGWSAQSCWGPSFTATKIIELKGVDISALTFASKEPCNAVSGAVFEGLNAKLATRDAA